MLKLRFSADPQKLYFGISCALWSISILLAVYAPSGAILKAGAVACALVIGGGSFWLGIRAKKPPTSEIPLLESIPRRILHEWLEATLCRLTAALELRHRELYEEHDKDAENLRYHRDCIENLVRSHRPSLACYEQIGAKNLQRLSKHIHERKRVLLDLQALQRTLEGHFYRVPRTSIILGAYDADHLAQKSKDAVDRLASYTESGSDNNEC